MMADVCYKRIDVHDMDVDWKRHGTHCWVLDRFWRTDKKAFCKTFSDVIRTWLSWEILQFAGVGSAGSKAGRDFNWARGGATVFNEKQGKMQWMYDDVSWCLAFQSCIMSLHGINFFTVTGSQKSLRCCNSWISFAPNNYSGGTKKTVGWQRSVFVSTFHRTGLIPPSDVGEDLKRDDDQCRHCDSSNVECNRFRCTMSSQVEH